MHVRLNNNGVEIQLNQFWWGKTIPSKPLNFIISRVDNIVLVSKFSNLV